MWLLGFLGEFLLAFLVGPLRLAGVEHRPWVFAAIVVTVVLLFIYL
jgi:hypothetical protein